MTDVRPPFARRLWIYQAERFPIFKHGLVIAVFALAGVALPNLAEGARFSDPIAAVVAVAVCFLAFVQLRIADEHKDREDDRRFRPERPVPRGLIDLRELRWVGVAAAVAQAMLAWSLNPTLLVFLAGMWLWMALMTAEFFAPRALKARPVLYLASHMVITPLIALFAVACGWAAARMPFQLEPSVIAFLALAYANGAAIEIARKTWAPSDERRGVDTYSRRWGPVGAACSVAVAMFVGWALASSVLYAAGAASWLLGAMVVLALIVLAAVFAYAQRPSTRRAKLLESAVGLWVLGSYL
ncbi:MAG: UbiA family prenyltransferase, partial [Vitreimonas sp.]